MPATPTIPNDKAAAGTNRDGLYFVLSTSTNATPNEKACADAVGYHDCDARRKTR